MADQNIKINIGSSWNGSGMQKAMGAVDQLSKSASKAAGAMGRIGGAIGVLDGKVGQVAGAIGGLGSALATGGWVGVAVAGVTAIAGKISDWKDQQKKLNEELQKTQLENLTKQVDGYQRSVDKLATSLDKTFNAQKKVNELQSQAQSAQAQASATQALIEGEKGGTDSSRALGNLSATEILQGDNIRKAEEAVKTADKEMKKAAEKLKAQSDAVGVLTNKADALQIAYDSVINDVERREPIAEKLKVVKKKLAEAEEKEKELSDQQRAAA